jgi:hypothetical protein
VPGRKKDPKLSERSSFTTISESIQRDKMSEEQFGRPGISVAQRVRKYSVHFGRDPTGL